MWIAGGALVLLALYEAIPWAITAVRTESTDDAYVNGHVTFVAPRVPGQVVRVLVDDNNRVRKGALLVQLDREPYQVKVDIAQAALSLAQADIVTAQAKVRGLESLARSQRFDLANAMHNLNNQVADLHSKVDALQAANATLIKTRADYRAGAAAIPAAGYIKTAVRFVPGSLFGSSGTATGGSVMMSGPFVPNSVCHRHLRTAMT